MSDDFDEFLALVGKEIGTYRLCAECNELAIINPEIYEKPKTQCDPGYCAYFVPWCLCEDISICSLKQMEKCTWPKCRCGDGEE